MLTQSTYLGCHRVAFSCASRIPCLPRGGRQKVTHTHTCQPYAKIYGWRSPRAARTHGDYLCHCRFLVTARYQYHLYREQNIVGPTWPGRRESRSLARSLAAGSLTPSADAEPKQKGKGTVVGGREYGYGLGMMIVWRIEGDGRQRKGVTGLLLSFLVWFGFVMEEAWRLGKKERKMPCGMEDVTNY